MKRNGTIVLPILFTLAFVAFLVWRIGCAIQFDINCTGHLKRAADANTVELAKTELKTAIAYLDANNLKTGNTGIIFEHPSCDIEFWYGNLTASLAELESIDADTPLLTRTNALIKLRETLVDHGAGTTVTEPAGISIYPLNKKAAIVGWTIGVVMCLAWIVWFVIFVNTHTH